MSGHAARQRPVFRMTTNRVQPEAADDAAAPATPRISDTDGLVIGGGPAGSPIAPLLARQGCQVTQLAKDLHPERKRVVEVKRGSDSGATGGRRTRKKKK